MRNLIRVCACALIIAGWLSLVRTSRGEENVSRDPAALVQAALKTELEGPSELRASLLGQALARDSNFAPARWQSGFVRWDDEWLKVDDVPRRARDNESLSAYRKLRDALVDTADNHRTLANWCRKHKLPDEERIHWAKVLEFDRNDAEALNGLGLQLANGRLLTRKQIEQEKQRAGEQLRATQRWQPQFVKWRTAIEHGGRKERAAALENLRKLSDIEALPALEATFGVNGESEKATELNRLLIETVGRMPQPEATQVLLRRAIVPDSLDVRTAAADELKKRPMHTYVPWLIAALPESLKTRFNVFVLPGGAVVHEHEVFIEGRKADFSLTYESFENSADAATASIMTPASLTKELQTAAAIEGMASALQAKTEWVRNRVQFVLKRTTGFTNTNDPQLWEKQYNDYNGWYAPTDAKPIYNGSSRNSETFFTVQVIRPHSCFPAGTSVLTIHGSLPIEEIKFGDRVLTQDVDTGELKFEPVQATTLRPPTPLIKITAGAEAIVATVGHPFWVLGEGWKTANHLKAGDLLRGIDGAVMVESLEKVAPKEVYNLVVSELHNYFVGQSRLLVHDNSPLQATGARVPGLAPEAAAPPNQVQAASREAVPAAVSK